jgi:drug/metabolite transporter (DMT)-like permease
MSKGIWYMLFATLLFSVMQVLVKYMGHFPFYELIFFRAITSFVISVFSLKGLKINIWGNNKKLLILRGLFGVASLSCFFYALQNAPLASVITIVNIKPFLILVVASILLKEKIKPVQLLFFIISFIGIVMVKGFDNRIDTITLLAILGAALFASVAHTIVRKLKDSDHPLVIIFYFTFVTLPIIGPFAIRDWVMPEEQTEWLMLFGIGLVTHFAQYFLTKAYQSDNVAKISIFYYLGIVFALGFGHFLFDEKHTVSTLVGMAVIIGGIILNVWYSRRKA